MWYYIIEETSPAFILEVCLKGAPSEFSHGCCSWWCNIFSNILLLTRYTPHKRQVLRKIEEMKTRNLSPENYRTELGKCIKKHLSSKDGDRIDVASHFILRAAYCRTEDLRRWYLTQECHLFKYRLESASSNNGNALKEFLARNDFALDRVSRVEKERMREKLLSVTGGPNPVEFLSTDYYRVPFVQALELVARRECYVEDGFAFVPLTRIVSIVVAKFRVSLSKSMALAVGAFGQVAHEESTRIGPLLKSMNSQYTGPSTPDAMVGLDGERVLTAATVDGLAAQSMPLCMQQLHSGLKRDHKLKHQGRLQFGLFLKGSGMSLEEHTLFFQREFTRIMTGEQFNKQYSYSIRHMHGKEGKRASYTPYNCMKIIMGNPPQSGVEHHGCPYKHYDDQNLSALLGKLKIGDSADRDAIMRLKKDGNFQLACAKHFEVQHPLASTVAGVNMDGVGNHPNAWFNASVSYHQAKSGGDSGMDVVKKEEAVM